MLLAISRLFYNIFLQLYYLAALVSSPFNTKAAQWIKGRRGVFKQLKNLPKDTPRIWFHCASLGEYEQARPIMDYVKKHFSEYEILLTFFSPSGYEHLIKKKADSPADHIFYLPHDSFINARRFIKHTQPSAAVFVKYELWYYYLQRLNRAGIPALLTSAIFRQEAIFFKPYGVLHRQMLRYFDYILVQDEASLNLLDTISIRNAEVGGDTKFDRVTDIRAQAAQLPLIEKFKGDKSLFIAGSSWPKDEAIVLPLLHLIKERFPDFRFVVAPHEVDKAHVDKILQGIIPKSSRYSELNEENATDVDVVVIDNIGMLSRLYRYAAFAYIGGGFDGGIHNTLEAAANGIPVFFGPRHEKFREAAGLIACEGGFSVNGEDELNERVFGLLKNTDAYNRSCQAALDYVNSQTGATEKAGRRLAQWLAVSD